MAVSPIYQKNAKQDLKNLDIILDAMNHYGMVHDNRIQEVVFSVLKLYGDELDTDTISDEISGFHLTELYEHIPERLQRQFVHDCTTTIYYMISETSSNIAESVKNERLESYDPENINYVIKITRG
jgi:hypothetical protein